MSGKINKRSVKSTQIKAVLYGFGTKVGTKNSTALFSSVSLSLDAFNVNGHSFKTGERVQIATDDTLPTGLAAVTDYWIIKLNDNYFGFATSLANALAGTIIDITAQGAGNHTVTTTEDLSGIDRVSSTLTTVGTGTYRVYFKEPFKSVLDYSAVATSLTADTFCRITTKAVNYVEVELLDDTAVATDGFFDMIILGSASDNRWS